MLKCNYVFMFMNLCGKRYTVNSEIFARTLISRNFAYAKFVKINPREMAKLLSFIDIGKSCLRLLSVLRRWF